MAAVMTASKHFEPRDQAATNAGRYALVVGLGESGLAAARYLAKQGEAVLVIDSRREPPGLKTLARDCPDVRVELETLDSRWLKGASRVVLSPGLSTELPLVADARARGIDIEGELELFARAVNAPVLAVTGSNGKSTVTSLVAALLKAQGFDAPAGGNLGPPALELLEHNKVDAYVVEVSSFQIETTHSLQPLAAALLNISPDHIDRHGSLEHYAALKASLLTKAERAIVNWDDPLVRELAPRRKETIPFAVNEPLTRGYSVIVQDGQRWLAKDKKPLIASSALGLHGTIGEANSLAALALAESLGGDIEPALSALGSFRGLPHRLALVAERGGVRYINDSKATNVGAAVAALAGDAGPTILIAGGRSKGADFDALAKAIDDSVRAVILIGETAAELNDLLAGRSRTVIADSLQAAVELAATIAVPGDRVLLSPACASQDMFSDYRERGAVFAAAVEGLPG